MIFRMELRFSRKSYLTWIFSILIFLGLFMAVYPAFEKESETFRAVVENIPAALLQGFGVDLNTIFSPLGFLSYLYGIIQLLLGLSGFLFGLRLIGREKIYRSMSFLFAKPVAWTKIFLEKMAVGLISVLATNSGIYLLWLLFRQMMKLDGAGIEQMLATGLILQLFMLILGSFFAVVVKRLENPIGLASGVTMSLYIIHIIGRVTELKFLHQFSPFYYVDPVRQLSEGWSIRDNAILFGGALLLLGIAFVGYVKRDKEEI